MEAAWAAGFFDGEGCTGISQGGASLLLSVPQVEIRPLLRFVAAVRESPSAIRTVEPRGSISRKRIHLFRVYGPRAVNVLRVLWPYLSEPKEEQALHALMRYGFRSVGRRGGLPLCVRGHRYSEFPPYVTPDGSQECSECRRLRHKGPLAKPPRLTALEARVGIKEYMPAVQT